MRYFTLIEQDEIFHTDEAKNGHTLCRRNRMVLMSLGIFDLESGVGGTPWNLFSTPTLTVLSIYWPKGPDDASLAVEPG